MDVAKQIKMTRVEVIEWKLLNGSYWIDRSDWKLLDRSYWIEVIEWWK